MNYTIGDFLIRIKNAYMANRQETLVPHSKISKSVGEILKNENYIKEMKEVEVEGKKMLKVNLNYHNRIPSLIDVKIISKPSLRAYIRKNEVKELLRDMGTHILSTNQGMITAESAMKKGLGGEHICHVV